MKNIKKSFTLLEILVVIVIMSLLIGIAMPAFNDMLKGGGLESSVRNVCQILKLARTHAVSNNEYVAVLVPQIDQDSKKKPSQDKSELSDEYFNRSYRVCIVSRSDNNYSFERWVNGENWEFLPVGSSFLESAYDEVTFVDYSDAGGVNLYQAGINPGSVDPAKLTAAIVFKPSGKGCGQRYLKIGEATYAGGQLIRTNTASNTLLSVNIDQFSGRITFED